VTRAETTVCDGFQLISIRNRSLDVAFHALAGMTFKPHGRLATVQRNGTPQNSPVGFAYNEELGTIDIAGCRMSKSQKYRNIAHNNKGRVRRRRHRFTRSVAGALPRDPRHRRAGRERPVAQCGR